jgi:hypothetical protein
MFCRKTNDGIFQICRFSKSSPRSANLHQGLVEEQEEIEPGQQ